MSLKNNQSLLEKELNCVLSRGNDGSYLLFVQEKSFKGLSYTCCSLGAQGGLEKSDGEGVLKFCSRLHQPGVYVQPAWPEAALIPTGSQTLAHLKTEDLSAVTTLTSWKQMGANVCHNQK